MKSEEHLSSLSGSGQSPAAKHAFWPEDEISGGFGSIPSHSSSPLPRTSTLSPSSPQSTLTAAGECTLPWHPLRPGCLGERSSSPAGSGGVRPPNMHFGLKTKSLAMTDLEVTLLVHIRSFHVLPSLVPSSPQSTPNCGYRVFPSMAPTAARGPGGALKLPQRVRAEPGC